MHEIRCILLLLEITFLPFVTTSRAPICILAMRDTLQWSHTPVSSCYIYNLQAMLLCVPWFGIWGTATSSEGQSPTAGENSTVCEHPETVSSFKRCQGSVNRKNLASVNEGSSSAGLFPVPTSLLLNTCSLDKIKNRVEASVALTADFQSWDIDIGVISEVHLCWQKPVSIVAIEGYTTYRMDRD